MKTPIALSPSQVEQRMQELRRPGHPLIVDERSLARRRWRDRLITASLIALILLPVGIVLLSLLRERAAN